MKYAILLTILIILSPIPAIAENSLLLGALTWHPSDSTGSQYANQVGDQGRLIDNPMIGLSQRDEELDYFDSQSVYFGQNSVGRPMFGFLYETGSIIDKNKDLGFALGGYIQDDRYFYDLGLFPPRLTEVNGIGLIPVLGVVFNYRITDSITLSLVGNPFLTTSFFRFNF